MIRLLSAVLLFSTLLDAQTEIPVEREDLGTLVGEHPDPRVSIPPYLRDYLADEPISRGLHGSGVVPRFPDQCHDLAEPDLRHRHRRGYAEHDSSGHG